MKILLTLLLLIPSLSWGETVELSCLSDDKSFPITVLFNESSNIAAVQGYLDTNPSIGMSRITIEGEMKMDGEFIGNWYISIDRNTGRFMSDLLIENNGTKGNGFFYGNCEIAKQKF